MINESSIEKRVEEKFLLPKSKFYAFLSLIKNLDAEKLHPNRKVQSLYLDFNNICFDDHVSGVFDRKKIRFRWYDENHKDTFLEIKNKRSIYTIKTKRKISEFHPNEKEVIKLLKKKFFWDISSLSPSCYIFYDRSYFILPKINIRVTIDDNLAFGTSEKMMKKLCISSFIVELKYTESQNINQIYAILKKLDLRLTKISKYIICKERL